MKRLIALFVTLTFFVSCSTDDEGVAFGSAILPVDSVDIPVEFERGETYQIEVFYYQPTTCYEYYNFYYRKEDNVRTVAPNNLVFDYNNCEPTDDILVSNILNFTPTTRDSYIFKFWQGEDEDGENVYLEIEVPVVDTP
ncbi:hypothetical protein F6U93_13340 [Tamlana haliotis]|uniref:Uncharacterized protein n=1 Tax=Pseudotamlana haliotis TaxID=2614804 RepID=A0A6N6MC89_9FLAO|nr:hypothetical protein [Tamlana haliotis]KAB1066833.1 hypothetical protein F6U93_13340 [Tamlana haliotis]